jgi:hypothetical protein
MLNSKPDFSQRRGYLVTAAKTQLALGDHNLSRGEEGIMLLKADATITHMYEFEPPLHRTSRGVEAFKGGRSVPPLPGMIVRVATLEREIGERA